VEETDDSCRFEFFEIVPLTRDTDGSCTTECVSGDWSAEVKQEKLTDVKQEADDVCCYLRYFRFITAETVYSSLSSFMSEHVSETTLAICGRP